jgi:hypothetical protein
MLRVERITLVGEALECIAAVCRTQHGEEIRADDSFLLALLADASQDIAFHEVLLLYCTQRAAELAIPL